MAVGAPLICNKAVKKSLELNLDKKCWSLQLLGPATSVFILNAQYVVVYRALKLTNIIMVGTYEIYKRIVCTNRSKQCNYSCNDGENPGLQYTNEIEREWLKYEMLIQRKMHRK